MKNFALVFLIALLSGCAKAPSAAQLDAADYGQPPGSAEETVEKLRIFLRGALFDPDTAQINCGVPYISHDRCTLFSDWLFGWTVGCDVNAKNRFGGYVGYKPMSFFYWHGMFVKGYVAGPFGGIGEMWRAGICR